MRLASAASRFRSIYKTTTGKRVFGEINATPTDDTQADFLLPRRILKVSPNAVISAGEIIVTSTGRKYLLADNGDSERETALYRTFKLVQLDRQITITRNISTPDPVTGLARNGTEITSTDVDCVMEFLGQGTNALKTSVDKFRLITNFALENGDRIDNKYTVRNVETLLGVKVATVD